MIIKTKWVNQILARGINQTSFDIDSTKLHDYWVMGDRETWMKDHGKGYRAAFQAPAVIVQGLKKPIVAMPKGDTIRPYILASKYPNEAIAIAAIGRTLNREYLTPRTDVLLRQSV